VSKESLEVVQAVWSTFLRGGFPEDAFSEDVEWQPAPDEPEGGPDGDPIRGPAQVREMIASWWETVDEPWVKADEFLDRGEQVVVCWRGGGVGRVSRIPVVWEETHVYTVREGKVTNVQEYRERAEALEAAGESR
jgi:ketosteroid isomerase-like protein